MMLVPNNRLIIWTAAVLVPSAVAAAAAPRLSVLSWVAAALLFLVVVLDVILSRRVFEHVTVELPLTLRMARGRKMPLPMTVTWGAKHRRLRIGLSFPQLVQADFSDISIEMPTGAERLTIEWPIKPLKRGQARLERCYLETDSVIGFWSTRRATDIDCEIRAYPDISVDRHHLAALITRHQVGLHALRQIGKGRDFEHLRDYLPGDSYEDIHWKATARRSAPISKVYQIEKTQNIYVVIDASRLSERNARIFNQGFQGADDRRSSAQKTSEISQDTILERYIAAALTLGMAAEQHGDNFGLATFSNHIHTFLRAGSGRAHYQRCRDMLYTLQPEKVTPDFSELFTFLALKIRKRSLLIFLTCLDDPASAEAFVQSLDIIKKKHLIVANMIKPHAADPIFSKPTVRTPDDIYRHLAGHYLWEHLDQTAGTLRRYGIGFRLLDNETLCPALIRHYLNIKQRQLL